MLFQRRKSLDLILESAAKRSLTRQLGAFELTMLGIGAISLLGYRKAKSRC